MQNEGTFRSLHPSARTDHDNGWSQAPLPGAPENSTPPLAANCSHSSLQPSHDSNLNSSNYGAQYMSAPCYSTSQFNPGHQPSYGTAPNSSTFGAYNAGALTPHFAFDQQMNTQDPGLAPLWDASVMQLPDAAATVPYSTANDQSNFPPSETFGFQGWNQSGFASPPAGTSSLPAAYDPYRADNGSSWLDLAFRLSPMDTSSANDVECMTACPASSSLGASTENGAETCVEQSVSHLHSAERQGPADGITLPTKHMSDEDLLNETACGCLVCNRIGRRRENEPYYVSGRGAVCNFHYRHSKDVTRRSPLETCGVKNVYISQHKHERSHYKHGEEYHCPAHGCKHTYSAWSDLTRHTRSIHCQKPPAHPCPEIACDRHGNNGFKRKDKRNEHIKKVHANRVTPGRPGRRIQPAVDNANNGAGYRA